MKKMIIKYIIIIQIIKLSINNPLKILESDSCEDGYVLSNSKCIKCEEHNCIKCNILTSTTFNCEKCEKGYLLKNGICGEKKCKNFPHCNLCDNYRNICLNCRRYCNVVNNECSCTEFYVVISFCVFISIVIIGIFIYCLFRKIKIPHLTVEEYRIHHIIINPETENAIINQEKIDFLIEYFEKNKIINQDNINKKCNYCKENIPNLKLNCGCIVCFNCEKNIIGKKCLKCNKDIIDTIQISCGICFQNKRELIKLPCQCSFVICKQCFIRLRRNNNYCPGCREKYIID